MDHRLEPGTRVGDYLLTDKIGEGAVGSVFSGRTQTNGIVILKCISLSSVVREKEYRREVHALKKFHKEPHIVSMYENFTSRNIGIIVLEKKQMDLLDYLEKGKIPLKSVRIIFAQICAGVRALHHNNTAHLDIKPDNIYLDDENSVVLGDLGSSYSWTEENPKKYGATGTTYYCAPEVKSKKFYKPRQADIWSLGILLHVLLTGYWPFSATNEEELAYNIRKGNTNLQLENLPKNKNNNVIMLLEVMLSKNPKQRPTIDEIIENPFLHDCRQIFEKRIFRSVDSVLQGDRIVPSGSVPDLSDLSLSEFDEEDITEESSAQSPVVRIRQKRKKKTPSTGKRRSSWTGKNFFGKFSKKL